MFIWKKTTGDIFHYCQVSIGCHTKTENKQRLPEEAPNQAEVCLLAISRATAISSQSKKHWTPQ
jgi:hypothetical protein